MLRQLAEESDQVVYAVITGPRSNAKIRELYTTPELAASRCAELNKLFPRGTLARFVPMTVHTRLGNP